MLNEAVAHPVKPPAGAPLVRVEDLQMHFPVYAGLLRRRVGAV